MKKQMQLVRCTVNGREVEEYVDVRESLLDMLRNRLGLTSVNRTAGQITATSYYYNIFRFIVRFWDICVSVCHLTVFPLLVSFSSITFSTAFTMFS